MHKAQNHDTHKLALELKLLAPFASAAGGGCAMVGGGGGSGDGEDGVGGLIRFTKRGGGEGPGGREGGGEGGCVGGDVGGVAGKGGAAGVTVMRLKVLLPITPYLRLNSRPGCGESEA